MSSKSDFDVIVVGGGLGGLSAASRAAQLGLKVAVLERGREAQYLCNSRFSGGILHISQHNVEEPAEALVQVIDEATLGQADPALVKALAHDARRAVAWLREEGAKYIRVGQIVWQQHVLAPPRPITPGLDWKGRGPDVTLRTLEANVVKRGGTVLRGTVARALMEAAGACVGVEADADGQPLQFGANAVVIADGGYQANMDLIAEHITPAPAKVKQRGAATGMGDGLRMARAMGAAVTALDAFYGHMLSRDSFHNDKVWPYPQLDELGTAGIVVDSRGERFTDEGMGGIYVANMIARLADPLSTWAVFDEDVWNGPGKGARIPANPNLVKAGGTVHQAPTLRALADTMGVPAERFELTVAAYNQALASGSLASLQPSRSSTRIPAMPIAKAPYYAVPLCAGITYTMGGLAIDPDTRVQRQGGGTLTGLYAVGAATGGLEGGSGIGYVGGLIKAATFGIRAAEAIARGRT
ncbi:MAG: FAD-dependent oxidoreductase [Betaproteobacteria bacterium]|nr:MAG: FAD-dependent oxidoreductase [Betaproteobacteria bacterium]